MWEVRNQVCQRNTGRLCYVVDCGGSAPDCRESSRIGLSHTPSGRSVFGVENRVLSLAKIPGEVVASYDLGAVQCVGSPKATVLGTSQRSCPSRYQSHFRKADIQ